MKTIGIVGGGASGMMAAITAIQTCHENHMTEDVKVKIFEQKDILGKKILSTGNGRCNLTNEKMGVSYYRSDSMNVVDSVLTQFDYKAALTFFKSCGVLVKSRGGYIYPRNDQAAAVRGALDRMVRELGAEVFTDSHVTKVLPKKNRFVIRTEREEHDVDRLILATGGKASPKLGSDGWGYQCAKNFGHTIVPVVPALVQLKIENCPLKKATGVRVDGKVTALVDDQMMAEDIGEIQLTEYGVSGIPVFQISRYISKALKKGQKSEVILDFFPEMTEADLKKILKEHTQILGISETEAAGNNRKLGDYLKGFLNSKLIPDVLRLSGLREQYKLYELKDDDWKTLAHSCKYIKLRVEDTTGFDHAQACAGGVALDEIDEYTLESNLVPGLWMTGELLDADGICGGYNLQWAWATGAIAGKNCVYSIQ